jgi:tRNA pseudouridine38-40 synthase
MWGRTPGETPHNSYEPGGGMQNWKLIVSYDGTDYSGWQVQPGRATIQGELQAALGRVTGESPLPQGSGRTDAGVHALAQVASFALAAPIPADNLRRALNRTLPAAIRVLETTVVPASFHARHSTVAKTYEYRVFLEKRRTGPDGVQAAGDGLAYAVACPPFLARYVYAYPWPLDFRALEQAAAMFVGTHDFLSFAATDPDEAARSAAGETGDEEDMTSLGAVRTVYKSWWEQKQVDEYPAQAELGRGTPRPGTMLLYRVRGNGFLHHMVRNLAGTMLDVGRGYRRAEEIPKMIAARDRAAAGPTAPPQGLFLHSVEYPE